MIVRKSIINPNKPRISGLATFGPASTAGSTAAKFLTVILRVVLTLGKL